MHGSGEPLGRFTTDLPAGVVADAQQVANALAGAQRVLLCGNTGADGDVVGSTLALAGALRAMGKDVLVYNDEPYPLAFAWLPGGDNVVDVVGAKRPHPQPRRLNVRWQHTRHRGTMGAMGASAPLSATAAALGPSDATTNG